MSDTQQPMQTPQQPMLGIPGAIVISAAIIAGAIIFTGSQKATPTPPPTNVGANPPAAQETPEANVAPVTERDHILGNPDAKVKIVEYSDYDCPFCKNFHDTMHQIIDEFGAGGDVAWVYRHLPLEQLHPNAAKIAEGSECVAEFGGNEAFWTFTDLVFGERGTNEPTNMQKLPDFAAQAGVDRNAYTACVTSGKYTQAIADAVAAAFEAGARGTPHSYIITDNGQIPINGAQPYANVRQMVQTALGQ